MDIWNRYLKLKWFYRSREKYWAALMDTMSIAEQAPWFGLPWSVIDARLQNLDDFALVMARIRYKMVKERIPSTPEEQAVYWVQWYNAGGTAEHYLKQWEACQCEWLIRKAI